MIHLLQVIYKYDGRRFVAFQSIPSINAYSWEPFAFGGVTYLFLANAGQPSSQYAADSVLFRFDDSSSLFLQEGLVATSGCRGATFFTDTRGYSFLAIANFGRFDLNNQASVSPLYGLIAPSAIYAYFPLSGAVDFVQGQSTAVITIAIVDDFTVEPPQFFNLALSGLTLAEV